VPREQWWELLRARREFCERALPHDCRLLLFFIQDGAANNWLDLGSREDYIRDGLKLQPEMVEWALEGLQATRPDVAVKFADAVETGKLAKRGGQPGNQNARKLEMQGAPLGNQNARVENDSCIARVVSLGENTNAAYIRARLERDGKTELLAQVERGEISAHAAAKEAGYRKQAVCHLPTVLGFLKAAQAHLSPAERLELKEAL
jgi:hypothetical protein